MEVIRIPYWSAFGSKCNSVLDTESREWGDGFPPTACLPTACLQAGINAGTKARSK